MSVHAIPALAAISSKATHRWYARIELDSGTTIQGTATGRHAFWIEFEGFSRTERKKPLHAPHVVVHLTKRPDIASARIYSTLASGRMVTLRLEYVEGNRTRISAVMRNARLTGMRIARDNREEIDVTAPRMEWTVR